MDSIPLISLCIPTYNRCGVLERTIQQLLSYQSFDGDVELVISDNCSTDETQVVCERYAAHHANIRYYRNEENIRDNNFILALDRGQGEYLKLLNDWFCPTEEGLYAMKQVLRDNLQGHRPVFFTSGWIREKNNLYIACHNLDDYVASVSVMVTSNNLFGTWRSDWATIGDKNRYSALKLMQVDWTYRMVSQKGCLLCNVPVMKSSQAMAKTVRQGFNYFEVMLCNYYAIMQHYVDQGELQPATMEADKRHFLKHFRPELFHALIWNNSNYWKYDTSNSWKMLYSHYKHKPYFYVFALTLPFQWLLHASIRDFWK